MENTAEKRIEIADVLRGLAVMGIVLLHSIEHFNFYSYPSAEGQPAFLNFTDKAIWESMFFSFGGKAYAVFALLFGFSFFVQDDNRRKKGSDFRPRFMWRMVLLFLIGNINAMLFYNWGFGLHRHLGITYSFLVGLCLFVLQFAFCRWWMKRRSHGPFEYIWKKGTWIGKK